METDNSQGTETNESQVETPTQAPALDNVPDAATEQTHSATQVADPDAGLSPFQKKMKEANARLESGQPATPPAQKAAKTTLPAQKTGVTPPAQKSTQVAPPMADPVTPVVDYKPNLKFKVMDKEYDVPKALLGAMKDKESEAEVRTLLEKAHGLDIVKPKLQEERQYRRQAEQLHAETQGQIANLKGMYARGDLDGFFKTLNVPEERILQYVLDKVNYSKLPPEQRAMIDSQKNAEQRAWQAEQQVQSSQTQQQQQLTQAVSHALDLALKQPDVVPAVEAYDTRVGKPGAFQEEVRRRGEYYWVTQGKLIPPDQAVREVLGLVGTTQVAKAPPAQAASTEQEPIQVEATKAPATNREPGVIPNLTGRQSSPMPSKPKSINDLKELYKKMQ